MTTINLDDIIPYKPPIAKHPDEPKPPRAPSLTPSSTAGLDPAYSFPPWSSWGSRDFQAQSPHPQNLHGSVTKAPNDISWSGDCGLGAGCEHLEVRGQEHCSIPTMRTDCENVSASHLTKDDGIVEHPDAERKMDIDNRGMHNDSHYKSTQESTQESASWGPNAPMPFESSPHRLKLGHASLCNTRSLPGPAEVPTERTTGLSSKDQANSQDDLIQHTGSNFEIMPDLTAVGGNGAAVGNPEPCNSPDVKALCDIQPANDALNFQTEVSRDIVEAENRDIASITGDNQENNDLPTEEKAPCDNERRRLSIDEPCAVFPDSTSLARLVSPSVRTGERSSQPESPQEITEDSSRQKRTVTRYDGHSRSQSHRTFASRQQNSCVGKRKLLSNIASDYSSDDSDDPDDRDYVESRTKSQRRKTFSRPAKQARRSVTCVAPARAIYNESLPLSNADAGDSEISEEQEFPTSLRDTETIAVSGFLTRQILLSRVVYSFTFEEQREQSCSNKRTKGPRSSDKEVHEESFMKSKARKPKANNTSTGARVLSKDDLLLIELKEKGDMSWDQIAQHFPGRSKGALQVRYCTRLKKRTGGGSGHMRITQKRSAARRESPRTSYPVPQFQFMDSESPDPNDLSRQRYGPPRARRAVDRYSPI